jgi:hypothetical protein
VRYSHFGEGIALKSSLALDHLGNEVVVNNIDLVHLSVMHIIIGIDKEIDKQKKP